jgi:hypothetical protein
MGVAGNTYCFYAIAYDVSGNRSADSRESCRAVPFDDRSPALTFTGPVTQEEAPGAFRRTLTVLDGPGEEATFTFTGRRYSLLIRRTHFSGRAFISVDGGTEITVDLYGVPTRDLVYVAPSVTSDGTHTVRVRWAGTRTPWSEGWAVHIDGIGAISQHPPVSFSASASVQQS